MQMNFGTQTQTSAQLPTKLAELIRKRMLQEEGDTKRRKAIRAKTITTQDTFTLCIDDSSYTASADIDNTGINTAFTKGKCAYLAYRLHQITGLPFAMWTDPTTKQWTGHIAIALPNGEYLDIEGAISNDEISRRYNHTLTTEPTIHETAEQAFAPIGNIADHYKRLDPFVKELINHFCTELIEEI